MINLINVCKEISYHRTKGNGKSLVMCVFPQWMGYLEPKKGVKKVSNNFHSSKVWSPNTIFFDNKGDLGSVHVFPKQRVMQLPSYESNWSRVLSDIYIYSITNGAVLFIGFQWLSFILIIDSSIRKRRI